MQSLENMLSSSSKYTKGDFFLNYVNNILAKLNIYGWLKILIKFQPMKWIFNIYKWDIKRPEGEGWRRVKREGIGSLEVVDK